jgi:hypothetical protein
VSLRPCCGRGERLADNTTCGALCDIFPDCLPPPSPELIAAIVSLRESQAREHENHRASAQALRAFQQAIIERIEKH